MIINGNQKLITISKPTTYRENFVLCSQEAMFEAMRQLCDTKAGFALWMYLVKNQPNYKTALSSKDFMNVSGYKKAAYDAAVAALIERGFLVEIAKNSFIFYEKRLVQSEDKQDKECRVEENELGLSGENTSACDVRTQCLFAENTTNNINNISNNIDNNLAAAPLEEKHKKKIIPIFTWEDGSL